eukprot:6195519-Pleurochrysis_carterae.AAC.1
MKAGSGQSPSTRRRVIGNVHLSLVQFFFCVSKVVIIMFPSVAVDVMQARGMLVPAFGACVPSRLRAFLYGRARMLAFCYACSCLCMHLRLCLDLRLCVRPTVRACATVAMK